MGVCCGSNDHIVKHSLEDVRQPSESEPLKFDPAFKGPLMKRSCTDVICLLIFIVFLCAWGFVGFFAFKHGDIDRLLVPVDSNGLKCGVDSEVLNKPYLVFFDISECAKIDVPIYGCQTPQVCVEKCPSTDFTFELSTCNQLNFATIKSKLICDLRVDLNVIRTCQDIGTFTENNRCAKYFLKSDPFLKRCISNLPETSCPRIPKSKMKLLEAVRSLPKLARRSDAAVANGNSDCEDKRIVGRQIIEDKVNKTLSYLGLYVDNLLAHFTNNTNVHRAGQMIVEDVINTWVYILLALIISMVVCLIFIAMMRWVATPIVWISIFGVIALLSYAIYFSYVRYDYIKSHPVESNVNLSPNLNSVAKYWLSSEKLWLYTLIIVAISLVVIFLVVLVLRKRIVIATALIKEGSKAVSAVKSTVFFPIFPWLLEVLVIAFGIAVALSLASVGNQEHRILGLNTSETCVCDNAEKFYDGAICIPSEFNIHCQNKHARALGIFKIGDSICTDAACHFQRINSPSIVSYFHALNILGFFWGICFISAFGDMVLAAAFATWYWTFKKANVPFFVLSEGFGRTFRYHLGTLAFGSFLIAVCKIIRIIIEYVDRKLKKYDNDLTKAIMCCCRCFFFCLDKFLKFLNTNAYIMCTIHGKSFCPSARDAFSLLMRNCLRVIALDKVAGFLFFLSKVLISLGMGALTYTYFTSGLPEIQLHYELVPAIIVIIGTYLITSVFFGVYSMAVDTLFLCFLEDCERNDGTAEKPYYMSKQLMKILGKKQK